MDCCCDYSLNKKLMASCSFGVFADVSLQFHCIAFAIFFKWDRRVRDHVPTSSHVWVKSLTCSLKLCARLLTFLLLPDILKVT